MAPPRKTPRAKTPRTPKPGSWLNLFVEFITHLRIQSKERVPANDEEAERGVPLELYGSQRMFLNEVLAGIDKGLREFLCLKSRQLGMSTISLAIDIFWMIGHPGIKGALVTDTEGNRDSFRETLKLYINSLPAEYIGTDKPIVRENKNFLLLWNGSKLDYLVAGTTRRENWGESRGYTFAHLTEVSKYGSAAGIQNFREALAQDSPDRLFIYESTANGQNHYRQMWDEFGRDEHSKHRFFIGWWSKENNIIAVKDPRFATYGAHPPSEEERLKMEAVAERYGVMVSLEQLAWYRMKMSEQIANPTALDQNQPWLPEDAFVSTGFSFFQIRTIQRDLMRVMGDGDWAVAQPTFNGYRFLLENDFYAARLIPIEGDRDKHLMTFRVWEEPVAGAQYVVGCDPAYGGNEDSDRHVISVWRCFADKMIQVAEYCEAGNPESRECAWVLAYICGAYSQGENRVMMNLELYGPGRVVMNELENIRLRLRADYNANKTRDKGWDDFLSNAIWYMYYRYDSNGGYVKNFETTSKTKTELMNKFRDNYNIGLLEINSKMLLFEMTNVVQDEGYIGAPHGPSDANKDDRVIAAALANRAWNDWIMPTMMAAGATYVAVMEAEKGSYGTLGSLVNRVMMNFLKNQADAQLEPNVPKWLRERGFV